MSTAAVPSKAPQKTRKEKDKERDKERKLSQTEPNNERLKTVVRRLPPNLPEEIFWQSVQPWVSEETTVWKTYYLGKLRKRMNKENIPSRAYIAFKTKEQLALFSREYDGHVFRDKTGAESQAVVEFAPYPKIPSEKRKPDSRNATIEKDEDYISFIESLKELANAEHVTLESLIASTQPVPQPKSTPLLEALKAEKSANKDKEAILRNHAHYSQIITPASRKEDKKKATPAPQPQASKASEGTSVNATNTVAGTGSGKKSFKKGQPHVQAPPPTTTPLSKAAAVPKNPAEGPVTEPAKPAKAPRPPRVAPQGKGQSNNLSQNPTTGDAIPEAPARRSRPVIGLASRQFEAALSGVGGRERRAKGERGKEKESPASASKANEPSSETAPASPTAALPSTGPAATITDKAEPPPSPKKERTRRGGGHRSGGGGSGGSGGAPPVKISGILQRIDTAPPPAIEQGVSESSTHVGAHPAPSVVGGGNRGSGRRGRGGHMKDKGVPPPTVPTVRSGD